MPADPAEALICLQNVVKVFKTPAGEVTVLKGITLNFLRGEFVGIVGKSGSGKSTLINMISGIDHPTRGSVRINGISLHQLKEGELAVWRGRNMGVVFQFFQLLPMLTVLENTLLPMDLANVIPPEEREQRAYELLNLVGLADFADQLPAMLSGGQQQMAAIARALANDPPIILADEPTGSLDSLAAESVFRIFGELAKQGKTIIMVTHDNSLAERTQRKLIISDGEIVDEAIGRALPMLNHSRLLQLTHLARRHVLSPGVPYPLPGFLVVTRGALDVVSTASDPFTEPQRFSTGNWLTFPTLEQQGIRDAVLWAVDEEAEFTFIPRPEFERWLAQMPDAELSFLHPRSAEDCSQ